MTLLNEKKILLGITGGIAAYKSIELVRLLKKAGAQVQVVLTKGALAFVTPMTLQAISGLPVRTSLLDPEAEAGMGHIELAKWADLILIAPASADFIARQAAGMADDLLTTLCLATESPILIAPAMNQAMWKHPATQANIHTLHARDIQSVGPESGEQACGDVGYGRMSEPQAMYDAVIHFFNVPSTETPPLSGQHWVITAGPTMEAIDPVRFISNHSSGKMGYALANAAATLGATVTLISGPVSLSVSHHSISVVKVLSALDMLAACRDVCQKNKVDVFIGAAAVADFRIQDIATQKMKKENDKDEMQLNLIKNPDIIATVAGESMAKFVVGFAAETQNVISYAQDKLAKKGLDLIVANDVSRKDIGFNQEQNEVTVVSQHSTWSPNKADKTELASLLVEFIRQKNQ
ncbi:bifunctional phosphopantothenoylcysteine decarboxylase/phosphopantothenate--cysteine ligase CoaBC [Marinomonas algicola]|uniref:bifunctional phosphopantothenoylcysteine decarboxylase/phosphopantothenate--cysteine ligase CoaBC n=1 Tax=Marinomonas algicola TaxID=2773454 RepID=UPI001747F5DD|nr:bifunctional phosphopantothenoylcysteine decarboxylase/phosphopantothenate--cysteine ligase CoaBC [Marinomonas algicola]